MFSFDKNSYDDLNNSQVFFISSSFSLQFNICIISPISCFFIKYDAKM